MSLTGLLIDGVLILLLTAVLVGGYRLNRRIGEMREGQTQLADLVNGLDRATERAQQAIGSLKAESESARADLLQESRKARAMIDELTLITEAGDNLASRLEQQVVASRDSRVAAFPARETEQRSGGVMKALKEAR